ERSPSSHSTWARRLVGHAVSLKARFERQREISALNDNVADGYRSVALTPDFSPAKPSLLCNLGRAYFERYEQLGNPADLDYAIEQLRSASNLSPDNHSDKPFYLANLSDLLRARVGRKDSITDIQDAVTAIQHALDLSPGNRPRNPAYLRRLAVSLRDRFDSLGNISDIDEAIATSRFALDCLPNGHPTTSTLLANLAGCLFTRFKRLGHLPDINESIAVSRRVLDLIPDESSKLNSFTDLAKSFFARFHRLHDICDIEEAITTMRRAVALTPDDHPMKPHFLSVLGTCLETRFSRLGDRADAEEAVVLSRQAVVLTPDGRADKPHRLSALAIALEARFHRLRDVADIEEAIAAMRCALELTPAEHYARLLFLLNLASCLLARLSHIPSATHFAEAHECLSRATSSPSGNPYFRLRAALLCAQLCTRHSKFVDSDNTLLRAHQSVLDAIPPFVWLGQSVENRYDAISRTEIGEAITSAAAAAISAGRPALALEWLEEGRNVVWGQLTRLRSPLDELRSRHPQLSERFEHVSTALDRAAGRTTAMGDAQDQLGPISYPRMTLEDEAREHRRLATEYDTLMTQVRQLPGLESFLRSKTLAELAPTCRCGPVVIINVHESRCDALVLCPPEHVGQVPLPRLSLRIAKDVQALLTRGLRGRGAGVRDDQRGLYEKRQHVHDDMSDVLKTLWVCIVSPILEAIKDEVSSDGGLLPHVTWCTTGPLTFLPLHAAGIYSAEDPAAPKTSNIVVSSYTHSLSALLPSRSQPSVPAAIGPRVLLVSQPSTPDQSPLPYTAVEAIKVSTHFPQDTITHLDNARATISAVLDGLRTHDWVHLACHGVQAPHSAFLLYDGPLELARLMSLSIPRAELAVLSACHTAKGDEDLPEETVHLSAGMLAVGYKSVVGTMWSISDEDGPVLTDAFYAAMKRRGEGTNLRVAYALHEAIAQLREGVGEDQFARWAPFVHFGT
ncbi:CHAT domain-containing protein, partial [Vararia minispora EC-137]